MKPVIRSLTIGIGEAHPLSGNSLNRAVEILKLSSKLLEDAGYSVQTLCLSTRSVFLDRYHAHEDEIVSYSAWLQDQCNKLNISQLSLGPLLIDNPKESLERVNILPTIISTCPSLSASVQIASNANGIRLNAAVPIAKAMMSISENTINSLGNLRFAVVANLPQKSPFIPFAYQEDNIWGISVGLQSASLVGEAIRESASLDVKDIRVMREQIVEISTRYVQPIYDIIKSSCDKNGIAFNGVDFSPMPSPEQSIVQSLEESGMGKFGDPSTITVMAEVISALREIPIKSCGFNSIFLPVLQDAQLSNYVMKNKLDISSFLLYCLISGTGPDALPIPGDTPLERVAATILDIATIGTTFTKPTTLRLLPIKGYKMGDKFNPQIAGLLETSLVRL